MCSDAFCSPLAVKVRVYCGPLATRLHVNATPHAYNVVLT